MSFFQNISSKQFIKKFAINAASTFAALALIIEFLGIINIYQISSHNNTLILGIILITCIIVGYVQAYPKYEFSRRFPPDINITIKVGDIFAETGNLIIGMNDTFDVKTFEKGKKTIQTQFIMRCFDGDFDRVDELLQKALQDQKGQKDTTKTHGHNMRYPLGTVAVIEDEIRKYFCSAYSRMNNNLQAESDIHTMQDSLEIMWEAIRKNTNQERIIMPIIGSALARTGVSHVFLLKMIIFSFIVASKHKFITNQLTIVIWKGDLKKINLLEVREFLDNI